MDRIADLTISVGCVDPKNPGSAQVQFQFDINGCSIAMYDASVRAFCDLGTTDIKGLVRDLQRAIEYMDEFYIGNEQG